MPLLESGLAMPPLLEIVLVEVDAWFGGLGLQVLEEVVLGVGEGVCVGGWRGGVIVKHVDQLLLL